MLIASPIYEHKYYCIQDYINNLKELSYTNKDILLVDNSLDPTAHTVLKELNPDIEIIYSPFGETTRKSQCDAYNVIRKRFLDGGYDYLMVIESDLIPPEDIIQSLMANDKDICGAVYFIFGIEGADGEQSCGVPCITTGKFPWNGTHFRESFMAYSDLNGELRQTNGGCGLGCTLIKRKVIETVGDFRWDKCHADTYFHRDAHRHGFETWVDTRFIIPHYPCAYPEYF